MRKISLFIDGENLRHYLEKVIEDEGIGGDILNINFSKLFKKALDGMEITSKRYYTAKVQYVEETKQKSLEVISKQRSLKNILEKQGYEFIISGKVRPQTIIEKNKRKVVFKEKGVDVRIAVDLVKAAFDKQYDTVVLCSSDSDLQPAIKEARIRGLEIVYLGFEFQPNKGLGYTTDRTILLRNSEVIDSVQESAKQLVITN